MLHVLSSLRQFLLQVDRLSADRLLANRLLSHAKYTIFQLQMMRSFAHLYNSASVASDAVARDDDDEVVMVIHLSMYNAESFHDWSAECHGNLVSSVPSSKLSE